MKCNLKIRTFFKAVVCRIIKLTGNYSVLWKNLQIVEKYTEWNIRYLSSPSHGLSNVSTTEGKL